MHTYRMLTVLAGLAAASQASAIPVLVDFTAGNWSAASGETSISQSYGSFDVTLTSSGPGALTFNAGGPTPSSATDFLALGGDGIGIGDDEVSWGQSLKVGFSSEVTVLSYYFLDLFAGEGPGGVAEQVSVDFGAAGNYVDSGVATDTVGFYGRNNLSLSDILWISFSSYAGAFSDFALAGILIDDGTLLQTARPVSVPEPGTLGLLGIGLVGAALIRRRRTSLRPAQRA
jgi:hypothetical protein